MRERQHEAGPISWPKVAAIFSTLILGCIACIMLGHISARTVLVLVPLTLVASVAFFSRSAWSMTRAAR